MADVLDGKMEKNADGTYNFHVTVRSRDKGWDKYCMVEVEDEGRTRDSAKNADASSRQRTTLY